MFRMIVGSSVVALVVLIFILGSGMADGQTVVLCAVASVEV